MISILFFMFQVSSFNTSENKFTELFQRPFFNTTTGNHVSPFTFPPPSHDQYRLLILFILYCSKNLKYNEADSSDGVNDSNACDVTDMSHEWMVWLISALIGVVYIQVGRCVIDSDNWGQLLKISMQSAKKILRSLFLFF